MLAVFDFICKRCLDVLVHSQIGRGGITLLVLLSCQRVIGRLHFQSLNKPSVSSFEQNQRLNFLTAQKMYFIPQHSENLKIICACALIDFFLVNISSQFSC